MTSQLDMALDDIITSSRRGRGGGRGGRGGFRGRGGNVGPVRRNQNTGRQGRNMVGNSAPYSLDETPIEPPNRFFQHDSRATVSTVTRTPSAGGNRFDSLLEEAEPEVEVAQPVIRRQANSGVQNRLGNANANTNKPATVHFANLHFVVTADDLEELLAEYGQFEKPAVHFDSEGNHLGTAEVKFARHSDAVAAVRDFNGVVLDGKPMQITILGSRLAMPNASNNRNNNANNNRNNNFNNSFDNDNFSGHDIRSNNRFNNNNNNNNFSFRGRRGGFRGAQSFGRGGRGGKKPTPTAEQLDQQLETYKASA